MRQSTIQAYADAERALRKKTISSLLKRIKTVFNFVLQSAVMAYLDHLEDSNPAKRESAKEELNKFIEWVLTKQMES